ncbi:HotDog domain-containing protein [Scheffersomyces xylosifermentans]|uniref:HotDog domain-containing protein n=1 Tax=Scheffersomyces xylosifermentans TaxID=1304137 RepID=UPI00315DFD87
MGTVEDLQENVHSKDDISKLESKFEVIEQKNAKEDSDDVTVLLAKYPLEPFREGSRGVFGGEFISQGLVAAWETVTGENITPHSLHAYFVKAGSSESVLRWEVLKVGDGKSFSNRLAKAYQTKSNKLVFTLLVSFTKNNDYKIRQEIYQQQLSKGEDIKSYPFPFEKTPNPLFYKYKDNLDDLMSVTHTHDLITHHIPQTSLFPEKTLDIKKVGEKELCLFAKINDDFTLARNPNKAKFLAACYISDSVFITLILCALGLSLADEKDFFRVSIDHALYFHDSNFDPREHFFVDIKFPVSSNDRSIALAHFYSLEGKLIFTVVQEFLSFLPKKMTDRLHKMSARYEQQNSNSNFAKL